MTFLEYKVDSFQEMFQQGIELAMQKNQMVMLVNQSKTDLIFNEAQFVAHLINTLYDTVARNGSISQKFNI